MLIERQTLTTTEFLLQSKHAIIVVDEVTKGKYLLDFQNAKASSLFSLEENDFDLSKRLFVGYDRSNSDFDSDVFALEPVSLQHILSVPRSHNNVHQAIKVVDRRQKPIYV